MAYQHSIHAWSYILDKVLLNTTYHIKVMMLGMCITMATQALNIPKMHDVLYRRKFSLDKNFTKPRYLCIAGIFDGINFRQYGKGHQMLYVQVKKFTEQNFHRQDQVAKLAKNFS